MYHKFVNQFIEVIDGWTQAVGQACRAALMDHGTDYPHHSLRLELRRSGARSRLIAILLACVAILQPNALFADMIPVRHTEGLIHGFLVVRMELPPDVANGLLLTLMKDIKPSVPRTTVSMVATTPKPRLVKLAILPQGEEPFTIGSFRHKAMRYVVKVEIGGVTGFLARLMGKQPADTHIWVLGGEAPAFVKAEGPFYVGGPIWRIQLASAGLF